MHISHYLMRVSNRTNSGIAQLYQIKREYFEKIIITKRRKFALFNALMHIALSYWPPTLNSTYRLVATRNVVGRMKFFMYNN